MEAQPTINAAVAAYLSTRHRDDPASGCPLAAIGSELSRTDKKTREAATEGFKRLVAVLAGKSKTEAAGRRALVAVATMIGAVMMSRVVTDPGLSAAILIGAEIQLEVAGPATQRSALDALEARYPTLRGTIRDHGTLNRRPMLRYFACEADLSHDLPDTPLPEAVASGKEPFWIIADFQVCLKCGLVWSHVSPILSRSQESVLMNTPMA
jgi:hypothetical protein